MTFRGDERGAAIQIGAVILFAFIVIAMASYQATVVPSQNSGVEFNHNQDVQSQMVDLTAGLDASARDGTRGSHSVRLGTTYPSRTFFVNPGSPSGQLRTVESGSGEITLDLDVTDDEDTVEDFWDDPRTVDTSRLQYEPNYNEYRSAPTTLYEHSGLINDNPQGTPTTLVDGDIVDGDEITLLALRGEVQSASSSTVSISRRSLSSSENTIRIEAGEIVLPTENPEYWDRQLEDQDGVDSTPDPDNDEITLSFDADEIDSDEFTLRLAQVGVGDVSDVDRDPDTRAKYVVENNDRSPTVSAEVRDEYNNPVAGAEFEYEVNGGERMDDGTTSRDGLAEVEDVDDGDEVRIWIDADSFDDAQDWERVEIDVQAGSAGGSGGGGTFDIDWDTGTIQSDNDVITDCTGDTCIYNLNDGSDATLTAEASVSGATVDFSIDRNSPASLVDPEDDETGDDGIAITTLDVDTSEGEEGDTFKIHVNSGGSGDVITVELDDSDIQPTLDDETSEIDPDTTTEGEEDSFTATVELDNLDDVTEGDVTVTLVDYADGTDVEETNVNADLSGETATVTVAGDDFDSVEAPDAGDYTVEASVDNFDGDVDPIESTQIDTITVLQPGEQADLVFEIDGEPDSVTINEDETVGYSATAVFSDGSEEDVTDDVSVTSDNTDVVSVNEGANTVTGESPGEDVTVTADDGEFQDTVDVTVEDSDRPPTFNSFDAERTGNNAGQYSFDVSPGSAELAEVVVTVEDGDGNIEETIVFDSDTNTDDFDPAGFSVENEEFGGGWGNPDEINVVFEATDENDEIATERVTGLT